MIRRLGAFGWVLAGLIQAAAIAQTTSTVGDASTATQANAQLIRRRSPAPDTIHGSISGSQPNPLADHPIAEMFDRISARNCLGFEFYGYLDQGVTLNPDSPRLAGARLQGRSGRL